MKNRKLLLEQFREMNIEISDLTSVKGGLALMDSLMLETAIGSHIAWDEVDIGGNNFSGTSNNGNNKGGKLSAYKFLRTR